MHAIITLIAGILFGAGVTISGMVNPMRVLNFMDVTGTFDPTLIFVMAVGLATTFIGYRVVFKRQQPLYARAFQLPAKRPVDVPLVSGALLFGVGWGLSGFCPGPAVASLVFGYSKSFMFVAAMAAGIMLCRLAQSARAVPATPASPHEAG